MTIISNRRLTYLIAGWMIAILAESTSVLGYTSASPPPVGTKFKPGPWGYAHATFYGDETGGETMGGACGYGNLFNSGYGFETAALSTVLFKNGESCGQCFQLICAYSKWCYKYTPPITITSTNLCPPNWYKPNDDGGWCNPPRPHFDLSKIAFMKIAVWTAGIVPVYYRRVPCIKKGGIRFKLEGNPHWLLVYVMNVGGAGDISDMWVKGTKTDWLKMSRNWGAAFQAFEELRGQALSFKVKSRSTGQVLTAEYVTNDYWYTGTTYQSNVNFR